MKKILLTLFVAFFVFLTYAAAAYQPHFSTAGFFEIAGTGRNAYSMNPAWRMHKGHVDGAVRKHLGAVPDIADDYEVRAFGINFLS